MGASVLTETDSSGRDGVMTEIPFCSSVSQDKGSTSSERNTEPSKWEGTAFSSAELREKNHGGTQDCDPREDWAETLR